MEKERTNERCSQTIDMFEEEIETNKDGTDMNRNGEKWTYEEDDYIVNHHSEMNSVELAKILHRTPSSVRTRCGILGVSMKVHEQKTRVRKKGNNEFRITNPLVDSETLCGVGSLRALSVPLNEIAEVICHD